MKCVTEYSLSARFLPHSNYAVLCISYIINSPVKRLGRKVYTLASEMLNTVYCGVSNRMPSFKVENKNKITRIWMQYVCHNMERPDRKLCNT
jgi:hypothetical protein